MSACSDNESDWSDVPDDDVEMTSVDDETKVLCLFCPHQNADVEKLFEHMANDHNVVIKDVVVKLKLDLYGYLKFINYVRKTKSTPSDVKILSPETFSGDDLLLPVVEDDMLLQYDIEKFLWHVPANESSTELSLQTQLGIAEERANLAEEFLARTIDDLNKCREELKSLLLGGGLKEGTVNGHDRVDFNDSEGYFSSYAHYSIHEDMLKDKVRTGTYQTFILDNKDMFQGARVLDIGCGTSILSIFAAQAGAKEVIGVDNSEVAYQAIDIVQENKMSDVIRIQKGRAEELRIDGKVDIIISEWMGYFLLFESMLDTVLVCRENFLSPTGCLYPDKCDISLLALDDDELYNSKVKYWDDVYGHKMTAMKRCVIQEPLIAVVKQEKVISKPYVLKKFDLMKISVRDLEFEEDFRLTITKDGNMSALVGYFDVDFEGKAQHSKRFSTSPYDIPTHWKQTVFFLKDPMTVKKDDFVKGQLKCRKNKKDTRALDITLSIYVDDKVVYNQVYSMV